MTGVNLDQLRVLSARLNEASDALSQQIIQLEAILNGLRLGLAAWVEVRRYTEEAESGHLLTYVEHLGYTKQSGKWGLFLSQGYEEFDEQDSVVPLKDAPRLDRMTAVDKIPDLVTKLETEAVAMAAATTEKATQLAGLVADLKGAPK